MMGFCGLVALYFAGVLLSAVAISFFRERPEDLIEAAFWPLYFVVGLGLLGSAVVISLVMFGSYFGAMAWGKVQDIFWS